MPNFFWAIYIGMAAYLCFQFILLFLYELKHSSLPKNLQDSFNPLPDSAVVPAGIVILAAAMLSPLIWWLRDWLAYSLILLLIFSTCGVLFVRKYASFYVTRYKTNEHGRFLSPYAFPVGIPDATGLLLLFPLATLASKNPSPVGLISIFVTLAAIAYFGIDWAEALRDSTAEDSEEKRIKYFYSPELDNRRNLNTKEYQGTIDKLNRLTMFVQASGLTFVVLFFVGTPILFVVWQDSFSLVITLCATLPGVLFGATVWLRRRRRSKQHKRFIAAYEASDPVSLTKCFLSAQIFHKAIYEALENWFRRGIASPEQFSGVIKSFAEIDNSPTALSYLVWSSITENAPHRASYGQHCAEFLRIAADQGTPISTRAAMLKAIVSQHELATKNLSTFQYPISDVGVFLKNAASDKNLTSELYRLFKVSFTVSS